MVQVESISSSLLCYVASATFYWLRNEDNKWRIYSSLASYFSIFNLVVSQLFIKRGNLFTHCNKDGYDSSPRSSRKEYTKKFVLVIKTVFLGISCLTFLALALGAHHLLKPGNLYQLESYLLSNLFQQFGNLFRMGATKPRSIM